MNWLVQRPFAYRGLHKGVEIPENSFISFKKAIENNYSIELDVRITKDKKLVVFHDRNLFRICKLKRSITSYNYRNLKNIFLYETDQTIPLLSEVLDFIDGSVPVIIEVQNYGEVGEFENILSQELDNYNGKFAICSLNVNVITWFKKNKPEFLRGLIYGDLKRFKIKFYKTVFLYRLVKSKPDFVSLDYKLLDTMLPKLCRLYGKKFLCRTVNSNRKMQKASKIADNVIFENIDI